MERDEPAATDITPSTIKAAAMILSRPKPSDKRITPVTVAD